MMNIVISLVSVMIGVFIPIVTWKTPEVIFILASCSLSSLGFFSLREGKGHGILAETAQLIAYDMALPIIGIGMMYGAYPGNSVYGLGLYYSVLGYIILYYMIAERQNLNEYLEDCKGSFLFVRIPIWCFNKLLSSLGGIDDDEDEE